MIVHVKYQREGRGKRCRSGERQNPYAGYEPCNVYVTVSCPVCGRSRWQRDLDDPNHCYGTHSLADEDTEPAEPKFQRVLRYPKKPDGGRGFHYERSDDVPVDVKREITLLFLKRMWRWIRAAEQAYGISCEEPFGEP